MPDRAAISDPQLRAALEALERAHREFPKESFQDAARDLRRPFAVNALKWKIQALLPKENPKRALIVSYIDRGLVIDRLNMVIPHLWHPRFQRIESDPKLMACYLTVDGIERMDVGEGDTYKARVSDSLKRVAVHFGVGVSLSRVPMSRLEPPKVRFYQAGNKWQGEITQPGLDYLRDRYQHWLHEVGISVFGEPLEHGDTGDAQGDEDVEPTTEVAAADDETFALLATLADGTFNQRQVRGLLVSAGANASVIPDPLSREAVASVVRGLERPQTEKLGKLVEAAKARTAPKEEPHA